MRYTCRAKRQIRDTTLSEYAKTLSKLLTSCEADGLNIASLRHLVDRNPSEAEYVDYTPEGILSWLEDNRLENLQGDIREPVGVAGSLWFDDETLAKLQVNLGVTFQQKTEHVAIDLDSTSDETMSDNFATSALIIMKHLINHFDPDYAFFMSKDEFYRERTEKTVGQRIVDYICVERCSPEQMDQWTTRYSDPEQWSVHHTTTEAIAVSRDLDNEMHSVLNIT